MTIISGVESPDCIILVSGKKIREKMESIGEAKTGQLSEELSEINKNPCKQLAYRDLKF